MLTLQYERGAEAGAAGGPAMTPIYMSDLIAMTRKITRENEPLISDPVTRDELVKFMIEEKAILLGEKRAHVRQLCSDYPRSLSLSHKLRTSEHFRKMRQYAITLQGAKGGLYVGDDEAIQGGFWQRAYLNNFGITIGGGTSQIQTNIVAEHVLGLPKD